MGILARIATEPRYPEQRRIPYSARTVAGVTITPDSAITIPTVWACLRYLSQTTAVLPWHVKLDGNDGADIQRTHPIDWLLWKRPSEEWSSFQFRETLMHWALRWGNGYAEIERDQLNRPFALWPIHPERVHVCRDPDTRKLFYRVWNGNGENIDSSGSVEIDASDIFHVRGFGEGPVGVNVVQYAAQSLGWAKAAQMFGAAFFGNGMNIGGVVMNKKPLKPDGLKRQRAELEQLYKGPTKGSKVAVIDNDADFKAIGIDPDKAQFIATQQHLVEDVCFVPGTEIITQSGLKPIEAVAIGDTVLTHRGRWRRVNKTMCRTYVGPVIRTEAKGLTSVTSTANHPFYVQPVKPNRVHKVLANGNPEWVAAGDLIALRRQRDGRRGRGAFHNLIMPRLQQAGRLENIDMSEWAPEGAIVDQNVVRASNNPRATSINRFANIDRNLGWLCGLFLAEGSTSDHQTVFYLGSHEKELVALLCSRIASVFALDARPSTRDSVTRVVISHRILNRFFAQFGRFSHVKAMPQWCLEQNEEFRSGLLEALVDGDGYIYHRRTGLRTTSINLAWQTRLLLWAQGINTTLRAEAAATWEINGRSGISREIFTVEWRADGDRRGTMGKTDDHVYVSLESAVKSIYSGPVFNLEVEEDESYTTVGGVVHNCRWFGVPPHKVQHLLRSTFTNIESQGIEVVVDSISPWVKRFEDEADHKLFGQNRQGFYTKINMNALMRGDVQSRIAYYRGMREIGVLSANRILQLEDENTIGADGDKHTMQSNYTTLEKIGEDQPTPTLPGVNEPQTPANPAESDPVIAPDPGEDEQVAIAEIEIMARQAVAHV